MINLKNIFKEEDLKIFEAEEKRLLTNIILENIVVSREKKDLDVFLLSEHVLTEQILIKTKNILLSYLPHTNNILFHCVKVDNKNKAQALVTKVWKDLLEHIFTKAPASQMWMLNSYWELNEKHLNIYIEPSGIEFLKERKVCTIIENFFIGLGYPLKVVFKEKTEENIKENTYDIYEEEKEIIESILKENEFKGNGIDDDNLSPNIIGRIISGNSTPIGDFISETNDIIFSGEVFNIEKRELKNKTIMLTFGLTDYTGSILVKIFLSGEQKSLEFRFKEGLWLKVRGKIERSKYSQEYELIPFDVNIDKKPERIDTKPEKRVELHLHTRYSSMDA
ncbi:OB-fold nucleic acid binding domain-containing protein, partial [Tepidanaerobacter acetatoxydans]|uniref:OB-fold nucleic acid binding domain-containing protein n=1 Tax=Tepidanaerobacter acetatoxydans TaxID=499229 RepID=UPI0030811A11